MKILRYLPVFLILASVSAVPSFAHQQNKNIDVGTRSVKGVVTGSNGKPVSGAVVLLKDNKTLQVRSFVTKEDGSYRFHGLSPNNDYQLRAQYNGASSSSKTLTSFDNRKEATVDLKLK